MGSLYYFSFPLLLSSTLLLGALFSPSFVGYPPALLNTLFITLEKSCEIASLTLTE